MSYSHYWFLALVDDEEHARLQPAFETAAAQMTRTDAQEVAWRAWLAAGECVDMDHRGLPAEAMTRRVDWFNEFIWIFNPEAFRALGREVLSTLDEQRSAGFLILNNCAPLAVLWQALGTARAQQLPGVLGNLLIPADGVDAALAQVRAAMSGLDPERAIESGHALSRFSNDRSDVRAVLELLPQGLERALAARRGVIALAHPQW